MNWGAWAALAGLAGVALQLQQRALWSLPAYAGGTLLALVALALLLQWRRRSGGTGHATWFGHAVWLAAICASALALGGLSTGWRAALTAQSAIDPALEGRDIAVEGVVASMPQAGDAALRFRFDIESASLAGQPVRAPASVWLGWYGGFFPGDLQRLPPDLRAGDRWRFNVRLKAPHGGLNPHGFDFELWMWEQGLQATGYVRAGPRDPAPQRVAAGWSHPVERARQAVRDRIVESVPDARIAGILAALVTGDQRAIDVADWDLFRATGVAHLMSISGLHITMFAWLAVALVGALWRRSARLCLWQPAQHAGLVAGVLLAAGYALFSGWGVPAQRTVTMLTVMALLRWRGRVWPALWTWLAAACAVVLVDPYAMLQPGFWLSFVAVGVLFASGPARDDRHRPGVPPARQARVWWRWLGEGWGHLGRLWREQLLVTLALSPLGLLLFGQVSLVGLLANLLAIPWVTLLVTPLALAGVLFNPLWSAAGAALQAMATVLAALGDWPWASLWRPIPDLWAGVAALAGGVLLVLKLPPWLRVLGLPLMLPALLWQLPRPAPGSFELIAADIGQGNAVLVRTAHHALLYDAGPRYSRESDAGHRVLVPLLRARGERIDTLVISHRDSDHSGGAAAVLAQQPQASWLTSVDGWREMPHLQSLRPAERCEAGQQWTWDGVRFEVLHPRPADYADAKRPNALSCVIRVSAGEGAARRTALLTGDIEQAQEAALLAAGVLHPVDWMMVPHHGSKTSSSEAFLDALQPRIAVVQAGYRNRFGHPAPPVVQRYRERGVQLVRSAECGAFLWSSVSPGHGRCWRQERQRYWHHRPPSGDTTASEG